MRRRIFCLMGVCAGIGFSQWIPASAKQRRLVFAIDAQGRESLVQEERGSYSRSRTGAALSTLWRVDGGVERTATARATLNDPESGQIFELAYDRSVATRRGMLRRPYVPRSAAEWQTAGRPERRHEGLRCVEMPVRGAMVESGFDCVSPDYDLTLRFEAVLRNRGGRSRVVEELYDIRVGVEPEPAALRLPPGFAVR